MSILSKIKLSTCLLALIISVFYPVFSVFASHKTFESFIVTNPNKIEFSGGNAGGQFGASVASGDVNGDEISDLIIGSPFYSGEGKEWNGAVSIVLGGTDPSKNDVALQFLGENSGDVLGTTISSGDYNNDGIDDIAIGAYNAYFSGSKTGVIYIVYGSVVWNSQMTTQVVDFALEKPDLVFAGEAEGDNFGLALETTDINLDGVDDLLVGAPFASSRDESLCGAVYGFLGGKEITLERSFTIYGAKTRSRFGAKITTGNLLGNGRNDVVISAYGENTRDYNAAGKVYIYKNRENLVFDKPIMTIEGTISKEWFGFDMDIGDVNADGFEDLVASSFPYFDPTIKGKIYIIYGNTELPKKGSKVTNKSKFIKNMGEETLNEEIFGASVNVFDLNNNGFADIAVGAPGVGSPVSSEEGSLYIYYGNKGEGLVNSVIYGENADDWFSYGISHFDFNNDGYEDLAIGSRYSDSLNMANNGKVFVLFGKDKPFGNTKTILGSGEFVTRGDFIKLVVDKFDLRNKNKDFIENCYLYKDFCFFNFMTMSRYDDIQLEPALVLYPDVTLDSNYYESVNVATMLGLINGYLDEKNSPFHPERSISRIQALRVILMAASLVEPKYHFEITETPDSYFKDVDAKISHMWWYLQYVNFAVENNIIDKGDYFRPDEDITLEELNNMLNRTYEKIDASGNS